ncbi:hypothetical protein EKE94_06355 [Mesobaculum littorinae]|uniref:Uncharacterized protein n=1 Tax=Mesobaculum littorinae TaxID=2486419 RepID=A0A438AIP8_9RHOB|nr:hypothetical protein [Mesobaculum littorinae]RVV98534.1 hypothetical protein EKE94_06355 [Mesobaculum littorinae]
MPINPTHPMHARRLSRNVGLGLVLAFFVALVFALTVVKVQRLGPIESPEQALQSAAPAGAGPAETTVSPDVMPAEDATR